MGGGGAALESRVDFGGGGWGGGLAQKEKSPDFRCPEVGISAVVICRADCFTWVVSLLMNCCYLSSSAALLG